MQVRQTRTPSSGLSMRTTRPQRPQAGRTTPATPGAVEHLDEPRDRAQRRQMSVPGQQRRVLFQRPCQFLLV